MMIKANLFALHLELYFVCSDIKGWRFVPNFFQNTFFVIAVH